MIKHILTNIAILLTLLVALSSCERGGENVANDIIELYDGTELNAAAIGGTMRFNYNILNPVEGERLAVSCDAEWIYDIKVYPTFVEFSVERNDTDEERSAQLQLRYASYQGGITVTQDVFTAPLSLTIESVEATAIVVTVDVVDEATTWTGQIVGREWFETYTTEELMEEDLDYFYAMADEEGVDIEEYLGRVLNSGSHKNIRMAGLDPQTDYVIYVYGINTLGEATTDLYSAPFTTTEPYQGNDVTFAIDVAVERALATISITPSHEGVPYFNNLITREDFEAYGSSIEAAADGVIAKIIEDYAAWDYTLAETFEYNTDYLATTYEFEAMANTEYVAFAFKWNDKCERLSEVSYVWFEVGDIPPSDNRITIEISDVTQTTFEVVTTTTNNDPYIIFPVPAVDIKKKRSDDEIFKYLIATYGTWDLEYYLCEGDIAGTFSGLSAGTEYAVLTFGYEAGVRTTSIIRTDITTAKAGDIEACQYKIEISEVGDREAFVTITPSDYSVWYYWNVFKASDSEEDIKAYIADCYNKLYYADYWEFSYYELAQGSVTSGLSHLTPATDYKIVIIPMNPDSFEYTGTMRTGGEFTTSEAIIADITIKAGFDAYYDGDAVYAIEPDYMTSWVGWVVIPMNVEIEGDYSHYYYTLFTYQEGLEDPAQFSDDTLIDNLYNVGATWSPAYFRGVWDTPMMIAAVAFDYDGNPSPVYRERFTCTREGAGDPQEFVDYYMGTIKTFGVPASVVVGEGTQQPTALKPSAPERSRQGAYPQDVVRRDGLTFIR